MQRELLENLWNVSLNILKGVLLKTSDLIENPVLLVVNHGQLALGLVNFLQCRCSLIIEEIFCVLLYADYTSQIKQGAIHELLGWYMILDTFVNQWDQTFIFPQAFVLLFRIVICFPIEEKSTYESSIFVTNLD